MQFIDGDSVAEIIAKRASAAHSRADKREQLTRVAQWGAQIAEALEYAHKHGFIHRDIKPSNLIVDHSQRIWLTDFGLARHDSDLPVGLSLAYLGTPRYMSPEQASAVAAPVDHRTDIYSLGVTIIEWLSGQSLVGGSTPVESLSRLQNNTVEEPHVLLQGYSRDCVAVLTKSVAREPKDRYQTAAELAADLRAIENQRSVAVRPQTRTERLIQAVSLHKRMVQTAILSGVVAVLLHWGGAAAWQSYSKTTKIKLIVDSASGTPLNVSAKDTGGNYITSFATPASEVSLPLKEVQFDVTCSERLSYKLAINPEQLGRDGLNLPGVSLDEPQSHRWELDNVIWYANVDLWQQKKSDKHSVVLRSDSLMLVDNESGNTIWEYRDPESIMWGSSRRGCLATFQPDRCVVVQDQDGDNCPEIVFAHPHEAILLCLDGAHGSQLWRTNLLESAGILTPDAASLCPIVLQEFVESDGRKSSLSVVVASHDPKLALTNRLLMNVEPATGKVRSHFASLQSLVSSTNTVPTSMRSLHLQWGEVEHRPHGYGEYAGDFYIVDDFGRATRSASTNPFEVNLRLGSERPFALGIGDELKWHWIDGQDWQVVDPVTGKLLDSCKLPDDCVCGPKLIRSENGTDLMLTAHAVGSKKTEFIAWNVDTRQIVWKQLALSELNRMPQSYLSPVQDFPIVVDLDGDGRDEWIKPSYQGDGINFMIPPLGAITTCRGDNGESIWQKPCYVPSFDGMIERAVVVSDQDGDGWKDLLLGTRFQGGRAREGAACFVDLISGKSGVRLWQSNVRVESNKPTFYANELVSLSVLDKQGLIAIVTHNGLRASGFENARPYSTTFLELANGTEVCFGLGIRATEFGEQTWLEHRLTPRGRNSPMPGKLLGWSYPLATLWSIYGTSPEFVEDLDGDGYQELVGSRNQYKFREYILHDGHTGKISWTAKCDPGRYYTWFSLKEDIDEDGISEVVCLKSDFGSAFRPENQLASVEIISGRTGNSIWQYTVAEPGVVTCVGSILEADHTLPKAIMLQHDATKKVTCIDLSKLKVAWTTNRLSGAFKYFYQQSEMQSSTLWDDSGKAIWISVVEGSSGNVVNFIKVDTGEVMLQFPLQSSSVEGVLGTQNVSNPCWVNWGGRKLLAIQAVSELVSAPNKPSTDVRTDLWLFDTAAKLVAHWTETTTGSEAIKYSWYQYLNTHFTPPTIVTKNNNQELLGITTNIEGRVGVRLLACESSKDGIESSLSVKETVMLPVDSKSTRVMSWILDCDGDGRSDYLTVSQEKVECNSADGDVIWQSPAKLDVLSWLRLLEIGSRTYLSFDSIGLQRKAVYIDVATGKKDEQWKGMPTLVQATFKATLLTSDFHSNSRVSAYQIKNPQITSVISVGLRESSDPRCVRSLPWVVSATGDLQRFRITTERFSMSRLLKLAIGVFLLPIMATWSCMRQRLSIRALLLISAFVALAVALVVADAKAFPTDENSNSYLSALAAAGAIALGVLVMSFPFFELRRTRWRRILSICVYAFFVVTIPVMGLLSNQTTTIPLTYTYSGFWHIFWYAFVPTSIVLLLFHGSLKVLIWMITIAKRIFRLRDLSRLKLGFTLDNARGSDAG